MKYIIREMHPNENFLLEDFLYQAIYQPDKTNLAPRSIIKQPELQVYIKDFGTKKVEFAISVFDEYQKMGIGTALMNKMLEHLNKLNYSKASLAVQKENYAVRMYQKVGFEIVDENEQEYIMIQRLGNEND